MEEGIFELIKTCLDNFAFSKIKKGDMIYFVGIGGYSMFGLAQICSNLGYNVCGSDAEKSKRTFQLENMGIKVFYQHSSSNIDYCHPDLIVYSAAVPHDNTELARGQELGIPEYERSYFLGSINRLYNRVINIAGTHGKTTTTTMCSLILETSNVNHTAHIGAMVESWGSTVKISSSSDLFVSEACEYNSSFLRFFSTTAAILNIDLDHIDCFPTIDDVIDVFAKFVLTVPDNGFLVIPAFDSNILEMLERVKVIKMQNGNNSLPEIITFGRETDIYDNNIPVFCIKNYRLIEGYPSFDVFYRGTYYCHIDMVLPGEYNAMNAVAAIACAVINGADAKSCESVLSSFHGADNRFSIRGKYKGANIISDYAHHPSAISAAYTAATNITKGKVTVVFQPITYARAKGLFDEFVKSLLICPDSIIIEVYTSRENSGNGFSSKQICDKINAMGGTSHFARDYEELKLLIGKLISEDDTVLFMGPEILEEFADRFVKESDPKSGGMNI